MTTRAPPGLAFVVGLDGVIRTVLRDGSELGVQMSVGARFADRLEAASRLKWAHFLEAVALEKAAFDWVMDLQGVDGLRSFELAGADSDGGTVVVVATPVTDDGSQGLYEQLLAISNEQTTALRDALKRLSLMRRSQPPTSKMWDEQSRMNNELVNLQRELSRRNAELARLNEQKNELLGIAAHDLRNPISSVRLFCDVLLTSQLDERQQRSMTRIRAICDFMVCIVDDLLDLATLEAGKLVLDCKPSDLVAAVAENVAVNRDLAAVKRISIELMPVTEALPLVALDVRRFTQVLNNLLSNAVKYSHPDTNVSVEVRRGEGHASVFVRDRGQGIAQAEIGRLFKPFERTSTRATAGEKSTGLGLAIVDRMVRAHGGSIGVESVLGEGTTFEVRLPFATSSPCAS